MAASEKLLESIDAAALLIDNRHRIRWMNKRAAEWLGPQKIGEKRTCFRTQSYGTAFCNICPTGRAIECHTPAHYEFSLPSGNSQRNYEVIALPLHGNGENVSGVLEIVMDVTEKRLVRIKENELMARVEKMAAIGQLAAGVAHELNTPLGSIAIIAGEIERLMESVKAGSATSAAIEEYLLDMRSEVARCKSIIQDLLGFSKAGISHFVSTDINTLVAKTTAFVNKGKPRNVEITASLDPALPEVLTDPDRFRQVLLNVVKNAAEAVEERVRGRVEVSSSVCGPYIKIAVIDNGPGIPVENIKRVFEPFFTTKPVGKGTGLGLSVSYGIMRDLKGEIRIESEPGKKTAVELLLPLGEAAKAAAAQ